MDFVMVNLLTSNFSTCDSYFLTCNLSTFYLPFSFAFLGVVALC